MRLTTFVSVSAALATAVSAQSACSGQQYNPAPGYPAYNSGCYPTTYYATADLGNTNPDDAQMRCSAQCTNAGSQCGSYVAQLNKAADSNLYSGTCFFFTSNPAPPPRRCADTAYLLIGYDKDNTNACFSRSASAASSFCSSYLSIPVVTVTQTPPVTTSTVVTTTQSITTNIATVESTASTTVTVTSLTTVYETSYDYKKRAKRSASRPACVTANTPASRLSAACSCLSITPSTTTTTLSPSVTYTTLTQTSGMTVSTTVTEVTVTLTSTTFTRNTITGQVKIRCSTDGGPGGHGGCSTTTVY